MYMHGWAEQTARIPDVEYELVPSKWIEEPLDLPLDVRTLHMKGEVCLSFALHRHAGLERLVEIHATVASDPNPRLVREISFLLGIGRLDVPEKLHAAPHRAGAATLVVLTSRLAAPRSH